MIKQLVKTFNGYSVVYNSNYKYNKFVIKDQGKVVERYSDFHSCLYWIYENTKNFDRMKEGE